MIASVIRHFIWAVGTDLDRSLDTPCFLGRDILLSKRVASAWYGKNLKRDQVVCHMEFGSHEAANASRNLVESYGPAIIGRPSAMSKSAWRGVS